MLFGLTVASGAPARAGYKIRRAYDLHEIAQIAGGIGEDPLAAYQ